MCYSSAICYNSAGFFFYYQRQLSHQLANKFSGNEYLRDIRTHSIRFGPRFSVPSFLWGVIWWKIYSKNVKMNKIIGKQKNKITKLDFYFIQFEFFFISFFLLFLFLLMNVNVFTSNSEKNQVSFQGNKLKSFVSFLFAKKKSKSHGRETMNLNFSLFEVIMEIIFQGEQEW